MAFKTQADLDEALRVGTVAPEDRVVEDGITVNLFPQTDEEAADLFNGFQVRGLQFTGAADLTDEQLEALSTKTEETVNESAEKVALVDPPKTGLFAGLKKLVK